ncbi:MAG: uracil-DNA glycosylase [Candidatus Harrisonbacteria bacterium CG10_big_fil_rev_8_21_14_0_10_49_15]|uniref:Type-4 uracil-DNA glycosylase n=1 Tax=Candidatus Harrisonbacteria bacterium CG10_big_fil_rev_8_21_14_0_10_49_15 TaxID=1974587 RepID=A0A2H0UJN8_9BACT|nr:MAG: uracil-DNA glycosylase [Candidatus Harrisonbacteria bacterium CG10_big_fil_rev_8_21_14_0_10_49_15]
MDALNAKWEKKDLPLKSVATNAVPGEGNPDAEVLFIGEAPGKNEDLQGRPFVGAAGKFLDELIGLIGLKREDVFIANIIKHRPPGNRDPLPPEVEAYTPWLAEQIRIIDPKLIVALGRYAMEYLLGPGLSITNVHGQPKRRDGRVIMPVYHPAAALYRNDWKPILAADFKKIPKILQLIDEEGMGGDEARGVETPAAEQQRALL